MDYLGEIITGVLAFGGGALLNRVLPQKEPYPVLMMEQLNLDLKQENSFLKKDNMVLSQKLQEQGKRIFILEQRMNLVESVPHDLPIPMWMKGTDGIMEYLNEEYENIFLKPFGKTAADYIGKDDFAVWPEEIAKAFRLHDQQVLEKKIVYNGREKVPNNKGEIELWRIIKYVRWAGPIPVGIAGIAFPDNGSAEKYFQEINKRI